MLRDKNAIITGTNRGIGKAILEKFAENGCNIWACARRQDASFESYLEDLSKRYGVWMKPVYFELSSEESIRAGFKQIYQEKKAIDVLVNNAGIGHAALFQMTSVKTAREVFEIDFFSVFELTQLVLKVMSRQRSGSIINMASVSGLDGSPMDCSYGAAKAAVIAFTKSLAAEVGEAGIRVNAIAPGPTETEMLGMYKESVREQLRERNQLGRFIKPEEIAELVAFLASDRSLPINGQVIRADGGKKR